jgi:hypothetical protein
MLPEDFYKTTFETYVGNYDFMVMSFGLTRAPHSLQKAMNSILSSLLGKCVLVFFDDILVYNHSYEEHLCHLEKAFQLLQQE